VRGLNIAVFASGRGSNFEAIARAIREGRIPGARIALLIASTPAAGAVGLAGQYGIPARHIAREQFPADEEFEASLIAALEERDVNFIVLAGYVKKIGPRIIERFRNRIINVHPALLPDFGGPGMYGRRVHEAVLASGRTESGATVHMVDEQYDHGAVVLQKRVPVEEGDTPESLAARVLRVEHELYPEALRLFAEGKVVANDGPKITIKR
jgi:phosphoribosylglycinamide formyltransferase-1